MFQWSRRSCTFVERDVVVENDAANPGIFGHAPSDSLAVAGSGASRKSVARVSRLHDVTVGGAASMKVDGAAQLFGQNLDGLDVQRRSSGSNRTLCQAR